jgi:hypothetical protein
MSISSSVLPRFSGAMPAAASHDCLALPDQRKTFITGNAAKLEQLSLESAVPIDHSQIYSTIRRFLHRKYICRSTRAVLRATCRARFTS